MGGRKNIPNRIFSSSVMHFHWDKMEMCSSIWCLSCGINSKWLQMGHFYCWFGLDLIRLERWSLKLTSIRFKFKSFKQKKRKINSRWNFHVFSESKCILSPGLKVMNSESVRSQRKTECHKKGTGWGKRRESEGFPDNAKLTCEWSRPAAVCKNEMRLQGIKCSAA